MKKGGGSESTIIIGPSKSVLVYALHSLEYVLGPCPISGVRAKLILILYVAKSFNNCDFLFRKLSEFRENANISLSTIATSILKNGLEYL